MKKVIHTFLITLLMGTVLLAPTNSFAGGQKKMISPVGLWMTEDRDGVVELYKCGKEVCGRFYWIKDDGRGSLSLDDKNPDPHKRNRPLCQMQFMGGFKADEDSREHLTDGWIYSPLHGEVFNAELTVVDRDTLDLRGYILMPLLGETQTWKRVSNVEGCQKT